ncbi:MAG: Flagellar protein FliL, partial [Acidobacteriota bacterium]|nr:Flagellar protein FliL [Acidobacteriota bacterium]
MADEGFRDRAGELTRANKSRFPLILTIIIIAGVIGAGGFFAGKFLSGGGDNQKTQGNTTARQGGQGGQTQPKEQKEKITGTGIPGEVQILGEADATNLKPGIILLDPFTVNLNDPFARRYAEVSINLVIDEKKLVTQITNNELLIPRIRDEIFMVISSRSFA